MNDLAWLKDLPWTIVSIGFVVACAAFAVGRRLLVAPPAAAPQEPAQPSGPGVDVFLHGSTKDRRGAVRRKGNTVEVLMAERSDAEPARGYVHDRSLGGLCVFVDRPFKVGTTVVVRPKSAATSTPWSSVEVRSCRPEKGDWEIGCQWVKTPDYNVLLLFG